MSIESMQDIAKDISDTQVASSLIVKSIAEMIFGDIYPAKKFKLGKYDFPYDQYVDDILYGAACGGIRLRFVTVTGDYYSAPKEQLMMDSQANNEAIVLLSAETSYFESIEQAAKIRKCFNGKSVKQFPDSMRAIISERLAHAGQLEKDAKELIEKAIVDSTCYINGEAVKLAADSARIMINEALKRLIEGVYYNLGHINVFCESDADVLRILSGEGVQEILPGTGLDNEYALNEISQWLDQQASSRIPVSMGDVHRKYQAIPYGWREVDIAGLVAQLIFEQKAAIKHSGAVVPRDDRRLAHYLRSKSERDKAIVTRRMAPSEELLREAAAFLCDLLGQRDIPGDEEGLMAFVKDTLGEKRRFCRNLLKSEYRQDRYPEKNVVMVAYDLMDDILSQERDSTALLTRLLARQDELRGATEGMEGLETFFDPNSQQKAIFDAAWQLESSMRDERIYFDNDAHTKAKINEIKSILAMKRPYGQIKELIGLTQSVQGVYDTLLAQKREEVANMIVECMGDVHTLAGVGFAAQEVKKADERFMGFKQQAQEAESLTLLDAMLSQLLNYKNTVCKQIEALQSKGEDRQDSVKPQARKVAQMRRYDVFPVRRLQSRLDVDNYLDGIRKKLYEILESSDGIQLN